MELLNKKFDEEIIEGDAYDHQQEIAHELHSSAQRGAGEHHMPVQVKAGGKADGKSQQEGCYIWTDGAERCINDLFPENEIITEEVDKDIEHGIAAAAYRIPERLYGHKLPERCMEIVYYCYDPLF